MTDQSLPAHPVRPRNIGEYRARVLSVDGPSSASARLVALGLMKCMDRGSLESFASAEHIATLTALSERAVRTALKLLVTEGWLAERSKQRGRDYWQKIRAARLPARFAATYKKDEPAESAGSSYQQPAVAAASQAPGLPANSSTESLQILPGI